MPCIKQGGKIFLQLWHVGRISHSSHQPNGGLPGCAFGYCAYGKVFTADWKQLPYETPRALETAELAGIVADYKKQRKMQKKLGLMVWKCMGQMGIC